MKTKPRIGKTLVPPDGWIPPSGLCECGCGGKTPISRQTRRERDQWAGYPIRFIHGHTYKGKTGPNAPRWKGGKNYTGRFKYEIVYDYESSTKSHYVMLHRKIWEEHNGRKLRPGEVVHHINGDKHDNSPGNLVAVTKVQHDTMHRESDSIRQRKREAMKRHFDDPEYRQRHLDMIHRITFSPEYKEKMREITRRSWIKRRASHNPE
jgi:hypothetical protein